MKDPIPFRQSGKESNHAEEAIATLRAVAQRPAAEGLEERMKAGIAERLQFGLTAAAPQAEFGAGGWMHSATLRGLAAAAIVLVVVGGGWGAARYGRRQATPQAVGIPRMAAPGEFSNSGAMRTPQTLSPPKVPRAKHKSPPEEKHTGKTRAEKRAKSTSANVRSGNVQQDGAPERK